MNWVPRPPSFGDKIDDWTALALEGGDELVAGKRVIECGPEWGVESLIFATKAKWWVGVDSSPLVIDHLHGRSIPNLAVFIADLTAPWVFAPSEADLILDLSTFDDSANPMACYDNAARALAPGGVLITSFANADVIPQGTVPYKLQSPRALADYMVEKHGLVLRTIRNADRARAVVSLERPRPRQS